jgi:hypothetical protein
MKVNNPADFSNQVGYDLYLNPWWALEFQPPRGKVFCGLMTEILGKPDLWFQGCFHELLWGPRAYDRRWRPSLLANLSGTNGQIWFSLWLPWRCKHLEPGTGLPWGANVLSQDITQNDYNNLSIYAGQPEAGETLHPRKATWIA